MITMVFKGLAQARRDLQVLMLPPRKQARVLRKMGQAVARASRARVTRQETVQAGKFAPRKPRRDERRDRRKLLVAFRRHVRVRIEGETAVIYVGGGILGRWARQQQEGFTQVVQAKLADEPDRLRRRRRRAPAKEPGKMATRRQAHRLRALGWSRSQRWIMEHYSRRFAGYLIRKQEGSVPKRSWKIVVPARPFLGASAQDTAALQVILRDALKTA